MDTKNKAAITREYRSGDEKQIVELLDIVFGGWPKFDLPHGNQKHWEWKYQNNYVEKKIVAVNEYDGEIVGASHISAFPIKIFDKILLTGVGGDAVVHPDFRRMGLHREKMRLGLKIRDELGVYSSYAITNNPIVIGMFERNKNFHRFPINLQHFVRIQDIDLHIQKNEVERAWIKKIGYKTIKLLSSIQSRRVLSKEHDIKVTKIDTFDERIDDFWNRIQSEYDIIVVNNQKYLNWRYVDPRAGLFDTYVAEEDSNIVGFIVSRINKIRPEYPVGFIAELLVSPDRSDVVYELLEKSMKKFDDEGVNVVNFLGVKNYKYEKCLKDFGFVDSRRNHHIYLHISKNFESYLEKIINCPSDRAHFSFGNIDVV